MQGFNSKKGSAIVESVMIFPMVIMCVIAVIYMMVFFYDQLNDRVDIHILLRAESGDMCDNMIYENKPEKEIMIYEKAQQIHCYSDADFHSKGILNGRRKRITARKYLIDETHFVRTVDALEDGIADGEE